MNLVRSVLASAVVLLLAACGKSSTSLGEGGSVISGSAGPAPAEVRLEMPSSSSINRMQGAFLRAVSKSFLTFWTPTP